VGGGPPPRRPALLPERSDFLDGGAPAANEIAAFHTRALEATGGNATAITAALVPQQRAIAPLKAIPTDTLQGIRDLAMISVFLITGCRVAAITGACVGHLETDGVDHSLHVTDKVHPP